MSWMVKIENVSKMYRLGLVGSATIQDDIKRTWFKLRGKDDPFLKIGEENKRDAVGGDYVWALKDINLEVSQGEVLGIIGKNGAGKSTLLKLLSKVTKPSTGSIKTKGRIASLLEVGTGFHPELTGRENIFLNGAIMGMKKYEIKAKFDEIVDFSGCERYIDTPVKRYSSGMYVRLAFAVAAHLEPEILVVDEVLAVGDAQFQKKALGKMKDISEGEGRTVLFVSHNLLSIRSLCSKTIYMQNGRIKEIGYSDYIVDQYLTENQLDYTQTEYKNENINDNNGKIILVQARINSENEIISVYDSFSFVFTFKVFSKNLNLNLSLNIYNSNEVNVINSMTKSFNTEKKELTCVCEIPSPLLNHGRYNITLIVAQNRSTPLLNYKNLLSFEIVDKRNKESYLGKIGGIIRYDLNWNIND